MAFDPRVEGGHGDHVGHGGAPWRKLQADGTIRQIRIWLVPERMPPSTQRLEYSLVHVVKGVCVVDFDVL